MIKPILTALAIITLAGCTDAKFDKMTNFGGAATVKVMIASAVSIGLIINANSFN